MRRVMTAFALLCGFFTAEIQAEGKEVIWPSVDEITIKGTAKGGNVSIVGPQETITVSTSAGDTPEAIVRKLVSAYREALPNSIVYPSDDGKKLRVGRRGSGQMGLRTTDTGVKSAPKVLNARAEVTADNAVRIRWSAPKGVVFDHVFVYCNDRWPVGTAKGAATEVLDTLFFQTFFETEKLKYRIVAVKNGVRSDVVDLAEIATPEGRSVKPPSK